jgi:hypothetical protein
VLSKTLSEEECWSVHISREHKTSEVEQKGKKRRKGQMLNNEDEGKKEGR